MNFIENKLSEYGAVDIHRQSWKHQRWFTSPWPDNSDWKLNVAGQNIPVAHYGAYSGSTNGNGINRPLVLYSDKKSFADYNDKIIVYQIPAPPSPPFNKQFKQLFTHSDYEYASNAETFPSMHTWVKPQTSISFDMWRQLYSAYLFKQNILSKTRAAGALIIYDMGFQRLQGLYSFPVPVSYSIPTLYLDKANGKTVLTQLKNKQNAEIILRAKTEMVNSYQLIAYLPGKHYGTKQDEKIILTTHTDGPSISQENGALGLLGIVAHFSKIPKNLRPRTLMIFLDNRHYMPGKEELNQSHDWFAKQPFSAQNIVGLIAMEHLGQREYREINGELQRTGLSEPSYLWTRNNNELVELAISAVEKYHLPRVVIKSPERAGRHGKAQGLWYGLGKRALEWDIPAFAIMSTQGAYWNVNAGINRFDTELFSRQLKLMTQLTNDLMTYNH